MFLWLPLPKTEGSGMPAGSDPGQVCGEYLAWRPKGEEKVKMDVKHSWLQMGCVGSFSLSFMCRATPAYWNNKIPLAFTSVPNSKLFTQGVSVKLKLTRILQLHDLYHHQQQHQHHQLHHQQQLVRLLKRNTPVNPGSTWKCASRPCGERIRNTSTGFLHKRPYKPQHWDQIIDVGAPTLILLVIFSIAC